MDVIEGRGPSPSLALSLVRGLPDTSATRALVSGGWDHFEWGVDRHMAADLYDALNQNTRATGNFKGKPPKFPTYPRPTSVPKGEKQPVSVADIYQTFMRR